MRFSIYFLITLLLISCGKQDSENDPSALSKITSLTSKEKISISGQVFVVTQGKENIKLALVEVGAIPEREIIQYMKDRYMTGLEQKNLLSQDLELAKKSVSQASASLSQAKRIEEKTGDERTKVVEDGGYGSSYYSDLKAKHEKEIGKVEDAENSLASKKSNVNKLSNKISNIDSGEFYFKGLPKPIALSKTDADGKFTLSLPSGKYAIAATSSRKVFKDTESYYWLVLIDTSSPNQSLMLSNDNLFETKCKECVFP